MKKALALFTVLATLCAVTAAWAKDDVLKVGVIAELTGDVPAVGDACKKAAETAVKEVNDAGGLVVGGKKVKVELYVEDCAAKPEQSVAAAQKLITERDVAAIIGPNQSKNAIPVSQVAEDNKLVFITPWSTNAKTTIDETTGKPKKYAFRACFIDPFQGKVVAKFSFENLKAKKAAVLYDVASDYNKGIAEVFKAAYENLGGKIVSFETYTTNDKDFSAQLTKIKAAGPEVIFLPNYYSEVPLQIQQAKRLGITVPFVGSDSWGDPELIKLGGADLEGYYFSTHYSEDSQDPIAKKFIDGYKKTYSQGPSDVAALTYDAFGLLFTAVRNAGKTDRESIREALSKLPGYKGVTGEMKFQEGSGDPIKSAVILQIKGGKFVYFTNANP
jgi:branched-chain amino acid transport system substrate-binding protein